MDVMMENQQLCLSQDPGDNIVRNVKSEEEEEKELKAIKEEKLPVQVSSDPGDSIVRNVKIEEEGFVKKEEAVPLQISPDPEGKTVRNVATEEELERNKKEEMCLQLSPEDEAKNMWTKLRNNHRDALRRQRKNYRSGAGAKPLKPWKFQPQMEFLINYMVNEPRDSNFLSEEQPLSVEEQTVQSDGPSLQVNSQEEEGTSTPTEVALDESLGSTHSVPPQTVETPAVQPKKKSKRLEVDNVLLKHIEATDIRAAERNQARTARVEQPLKDDLYHFFMYVCKQAQKMSPYYQYQAKREIFNTMSRLEGEYLQSTRPSTSPIYQQLQPVSSHQVPAYGLPLNQQSSIDYGTVVPSSSESSRACHDTATSSLLHLLHNDDLN